MLWESLDERKEALKLKVDCIKRLQLRLKPMAEFDSDIKEALNHLEEIRGRFVSKLLMNAIENVEVTHEAYNEVETHIDEGLTTLCDVIRQNDVEPLIFLLNREAGEVLAYKRENGLE